MRDSEQISPSPFGTTVFKTEVNVASSAVSAEVQKKSDFNQQGQFVSRIYSSKDEQKASILVRIASATYIVYSLLYIFSSIAQLYVLYTMSNVMVLHSGFDLVLLKEVPLFGVLPLLFIIAGVLYAYSGIKLNEESSSSFWRAIIVGLSVPVIISLLTTKLMVSVLDLFTTDSNTSVVNATGSFNFQNPLSIALGIAIVSILISFKRFTNETKSLPKAGRWLICTFIFLVLLPTCSLLGYGYYRSSETDYGHKKAQEAVSYPVYKPKLLPKNLVYSSYYTTENLFAGSNNGVKTAFSEPLEATKKSEFSQRTAILRQTAIPANFSLENYITANFNAEQATLANIVILANDKFAKSYFLYTTSDDLPRGVLLVETKDSTLIELIYVNADQTEILNFATSIR